ncbi:MAG TPA: pyridoxal phosphate-dependent aminotransferase [Candidatus Nanoarchaeia archaeon]|nr:pyridoxal phosphate-dependent aminotransferase [Candidatus Nanoarchaeia archaeon]
MEDRLSSPSMFIGVQGKGIISFGSGQPDLPPPRQVYSILPTYRAFKYGLVQGQENLRKALSKGYKGSKASNFVITNGASEALDLSFRVMKPRDKVLIHAPYYYTYPHLVAKAFLTPVFTETHEGKIVLEDFDKKVRECKAVLINSPSNPTGRIQDIKTLKEIEKITTDLNVTLISDEVYKDLIYERENYMLSGSHVVTINSFSKTFSMCGFRVGYLYSNDPSFVERIVNLKTYTSMNTNILAQEMAYEATKVPKKYSSSQLKIWKERRNLIYNGLTELGLDLWKPEGAFYVLPKIKEPRKFVWKLFKKYKTITYLGEWFGAPNRVRFSYALDASKIEEGLKRVRKCLKEL